MSDHDHHCPFLNRSDERCAKNFSLERLHNTYDFCFGQYSACSVYLELLVERRLRRAREAAGMNERGANRWITEGEEASHDPFVPLTRGGRRIQFA